MEMQCENAEAQNPAARLSRSPARPLNELDVALDELGMLSTGAPTRNEYLRKKKYLNMLTTTMNTRYVSKVSIGFRVRHLTPHVRYKPYPATTTTATATAPTPPTRHRTRSENNDSGETAAIAKSIMDELDEVLEEITQLKKAKSLESIVADTHEAVDLQSLDFGKPSELEMVSTSIQNLKVAE